MKKVIIASFMLVGLVAGGIALADDIYNNLDGSIDATLENMTLTAGGPTGNTSFYVLPLDGDGKTGCNLVGNKTLVVNVNSSNTSIATVSPSSLTFTAANPGCGNPQLVTVTGLSAGTSDVTLSQNSNGTNGTFNLAPAAFRVTVNPSAPSDTTPPVIGVTVTPPANGAGWNNTDVTIIWTVNDPESAITSMIGCDTTVLTAETGGIILTCTATSAGGTSSQSVTVKIDKTKPVITGSASPLPNVNGWNNIAVDVSFACAEVGAVQSGIVTDTVAGAMLSTEGAGQSVTNSGVCTDAAGNSANSATVSGINIDMTKPVITGSALPLPNSNGWNNSDVTVSFLCAETGSVQSGIDVDTVAGVTLTTEGAGQSVTNTGSCVDKAGNTADSSTVSGINIDKTAPVVVVTTPVNGGNYTYNQTYLADWSATDTLSGIDTATGTTTNGVAFSTTPMGAHSYTVTAIDFAGNSTTITNSYTVVGYNFNKCYPPLTLDSRDFKKTSTIPVKCSIIDTLGRPVTNAVVQLYIDTTTAVSSGTSNYLNFFRYSPIDAFWIYNLSTKMPVLTIGIHTLHIKPDDGSDHTYTIKIK